MKRNFLYHFEQKKGFMNDPNGCVFFKGRWHMFFQYHEKGIEELSVWGHAVSDDLLSWEELEPAIINENEYETCGCWSGSAIVKDNRLYLFYTSAGDDCAQTVSLVYTDDCKNFIRYSDKPIISVSPLGDKNFRDPKVFAYGGKYYMLLGTQVEKVGKLVCFQSDNLTDWTYTGEFYSSDNHYSERCRQATLECPEFFPLSNDKWGLKFSSQKYRQEVFVVGTFDGKAFTPETDELFIEASNEWYATQTFANVEGRTVLIGWMWCWHKPLVGEYEKRAGTMSIPREMTFKNGKIYNYPVKEAVKLLKPSSEYVKVNGTVVTVLGLNGEVVLEADMRNHNGVENINKIEILEDGKAVEIFINDGEATVTKWLI